MRMTKRPCTHSLMHAHVWLHYCRHDWVWHGQGSSAPAAAEPEGPLQWASTWRMCGGDPACDTGHSCQQEGHAQCRLQPVDASGHIGKVRPSPIPGLPCTCVCVCVCVVPCSKLLEWAEGNCPGAPLVEVVTKDGQTEMNSVKISFS